MDTMYEDIFLWDTSNPFNCFSIRTLNEKYTACAKSLSCTSVDFPFLKPYPPIFTGSLGVMSAFACPIKQFSTILMYPN
ncbi:MAG: hypothetical protein ACTSRP_09795 [Candidatus Helarchaeota archaeon]